MKEQGDMFTNVMAFCPSNYTREYLLDIFNSVYGFEGRGIVDVLSDSARKAVNTGEGDYFKILREALIALVAQDNQNQNNSIQIYKP
jgi:hypothetical protein